MKRALAIKEKFLENSGFTLVELLMVVIILGILAAVVIPQFSSSSKDAKVSVLKSNLSAIRGALELYALQHNEEYPETTDPNNFAGLLVQYSNQDHQFTDQKSSSYPYGPYLKHGFPKNPLAKAEVTADRVYIDASSDKIGEFNIDPNKGGWLFKSKTGEFIANHQDYNAY